MATNLGLGFKVNNIIASAVNEQSKKMALNEEIEFEHNLILVERYDGKRFIAVCLIKTERGLVVDGFYEVESEENDGSEYETAEISRFSWQSICDVLDAVTEPSEIEKANEPKPKNTRTVVEVSDIQWDTDEDDDCGLPKRLLLEVITLADECYDDSVAEFLSDEFGFCHNGFSSTVQEQTTSDRPVGVYVL